jgi:hypothetical protein
MDAVYPDRGDTDTTDRAAPATTEGALVLSGSSPIAGKAVQFSFDGGRLTSDAGVVVLADIERRFGIAERLARIIHRGGGPPPVSPAG